MLKPNSLPIYSLIISFMLVGIKALNGEMRKDYYIAFMRDHSLEEEFVLRQMHIDVLSVVKGSEIDARESLVYSYTKSFNAFAAKLSQDEANKLSEMDGVLNIIKNGRRKLHTTRSWDFIGFPLTARRNLKIERDVIVGVLDTGITPQSDSFKDDGLGPPPKKWKGSCGHCANFSGCNNKLIGAKYFKLDGKADPKDILSPADVVGHGTHASSTAAGALIPNANLSGLAQGTARGAVPSARVAMYKVCWKSEECSDMDVLAGFNEAINDGVDVISVSLGGDYFLKYSEDIVAIGSFHAMRKGIITVASAGNSGPDLGAMSNYAPWILTVAASGIDRQFISKIEMGNGRIVSGIGLNFFDLKQRYPLIRGYDAAKNNQSKELASLCTDDALDPKKVKGKIVQCNMSPEPGDYVIKKLKGTGVIIEMDDNTYMDTAVIFMAPASYVNATVGHTLSRYITSTRSPTGVIYKTIQVKIPAPFTASFSSRGPNPASAHLLKPDITAPGIDILASYTPLNSLTGIKGDTQYANFNIMSGTSMSCPHVSGVAAYVKSFHPTWSPAAIKSAIMTTATPMSSKVNNESEFAYGVGQLNPTRALRPGLIYDMDKLSYLQFLCHEGIYNDSEIATISGSHSFKCSSIVPGRGEDALNYPTFQLHIKNDQEPTTGVFWRTVTNVGTPQSVYKAIVRAPKGVEISVEPVSLNFTCALEQRRFKVVVKANPMSSSKVMASGLLTWKNSKYSVRSPIVVSNVDFR
ncbi:hypothetical protein LguiA_019171 [Lonicera macranthoides]